MPEKAKESAQVQKARQKIKEQLDTSEKLINADALYEMSKIIQRQLARRSTERVNLKEKTITLFDENQHPAKTQSKFVNRLLRHLKEEVVKEPPKDLEGRIKIQTP